MFDFSTLSGEQTQSLIDGFEKLKSIAEVIEFEWGIEANAKDSSQGFTYKNSEIFMTKILNEN